MKLKKIPNTWKALLTAAAVFFALTASLGRPEGGLWNSPDEAANAFWSMRVAHGEPLVLRDVIVGLGRGAVHPRSFAVYGDALMPGSFPGLFLLYGTLNLALGFPLWILTPLFTALAGMALFPIMRKLFDAREAFWTALLFFAHPAVIYYASRGLYHNMLLVDLLILAAFLLMRFPKAGIVGGIVLGWALITRASEAPWVLLGALAFLPLVKEDRPRRLAKAALGATIPVGIFLILNAALFGSPFQTGYVLPDDRSQVTGHWSQAFFPFGFHPRLIILHAYEYGLGLFWWLSIPAALGAAALLMRWRSLPPERRRYVAVALAASAWLCVFYGSWQIRDRFIPEEVTIGTSYVRYFLPAYVLLLPFVVHGLLAIADKAKKPRRLMAEFAIIVAAFSLYAAVYRGDEGLLAVRRIQAENVVKKETLLRLVPEDAIIMTERFDKLLFPERWRIIPSFDPISLETAESLTHYAPVLYYGLDGAVEQAKMELEEIARPFPGEALYRFLKRR